MTLVVGATVHFANSLEEAMSRRYQRNMRTSYMLDGTIDPETERGAGLFTDRELDLIILERDRLSPAVRPAPASAREHNVDPLGLR